MREDYYAHLVIFYVVVLWVVGELVPISSIHLVRGKVHPGNFTTPSQGNTKSHRI